MVSQVLFPAGFLPGCIRRGREAVTGISHLEARLTYFSQDARTNTAVVAAMVIVLHLKQKKKLKREESIGDGFGIV